MTKEVGRTTEVVEQEEGIRGEVSMDELKGRGGIDVVVVKTVGSVTPVVTTAIGVAGSVAGTAASTSTDGCPPDTRVMGKNMGNNIVQTRANLSRPQTTNPGQNRLMTENIKNKIDDKIQSAVHNNYSS